MRFSLRSTSFAFALLVAPALAAAQGDAPPPPSGDWRVVVTDSEEDVGRIIGFADVGSLRRAGSRISFWLEYRLERAAGGADGYRGYVSADCGAFTHSATSLARLSGATILGQEADEAVQTAGPGTNMRVALDALCGGTYQTGTVDPVSHARAAFATAE